MGDGIIKPNFDFGDVLLGNAWKKIVKALNITDWGLWISLIFALFELKIKLSILFSKRLKCVLFKKGCIWGTLFSKVVILQFENMIATTLNSSRVLNFGPACINLGLKNLSMSTWYDSSGQKSFFSKRGLMGCLFTKNRSSVLELLEAAPLLLKYPPKVLLLKQSWHLTY